MTERDLFYALLDRFLMYLADGWKVAEGPHNEPAFVGTHHGRHSVLVYREILNDMASLDTGRR